MKYKSKIIVFALPVTLILLGLVIYDYGFLTIQAERIAVKEMYTLKMKSLEKSLTLIAQKPQLESRLASLKEIRKADNVKIIEGQTVPLAAAALQNAVKGIITGRGGTLSSERVEKPEDLGSFRIISIIIDTTMPDTRALSDTLFAIETQTPFLLIKELDTGVRNYREPRELQVKLKVSAVTTAR